MIDLKFFGIGGALNAELDGNSAFILRDDTLILFDCSEGVRTKAFKLGMFENIKNVYVVLTHLHSDHVAGIGTLIWTLYYKYKIMTQVLTNNDVFEKSLKEMLDINGVKAGYNFISGSILNIKDLQIETVSTPHEENMECFGIYISDKDEKVYYTGDTNDIDFIRQLNDDKGISKIYCEIASIRLGSHLCYEDLISLNQEKFIYMHINDMWLYDFLKENGYRIANKV